MLQMARLQVQLKKRRLMRSAISEKSKLTIDADLVSQPVYVLDAEDEDTGNELRNFRKKLFFFDQPFRYKYYKKYSLHLSDAIFIKNSPYNNFLLF